MRQQLNYDPDQARRSDDGRFWISWDDVTKEFRGMSIAYNFHPSRFPHRVDIHSCFNPSGQTAFVSSARMISGFSPQFALVFHPTTADFYQSELNVWVQLHRHVTSGKNVKKAKEKIIRISTNIYAGSERILGENTARDCYYGSSINLMIKLDKFKLPWKKDGWHRCVVQALQSAV